MLQLSIESEASLVSVIVEDWAEVVDFTEATLAWEYWHTLPRQRDIDVTIDLANLQRQAVAVRAEPASIH